MCPIYEYECKHCNERFELIQHYTSGVRAICVFCGKKVKRIISTSNFKLKGSGFYNPYKGDKDESD